MATTTAEWHPDSASAVAREGGRCSWQEDGRQARAVGEGGAAGKQSGKAVPFPDQGVLLQSLEAVGEGNTPGEP